MVEILTDWWSEITMKRWHRSYHLLTYPMVQLASICVITYWLWIEIHATLLELLHPNLFTITKARSNALWTSQKAGRKIDVASSELFFYHGSSPPKSSPGDCPRFILNPYIHPYNFTFGVHARIEPNIIQHRSCIRHCSMVFYRLIRLNYMWPWHLACLLRIKYYTMCHFF